MKRLIYAALAATLATTAVSAQSLDDALVTEIRGSFAHTPENKALQNAISNNSSFRELALDRSTQGSIDHYFRYRAEVSGITDQKQSGRCWMFTSMNVLRPSVMRKFNISEFDFSHSFCYFWDMFEKSNLFLENVIATADKDIIMDRDVAFWFRDPVNDGGVWNSFFNIAGKYGVVPAEVMPETAHSEKTSGMVSVLNELLRKEGWTIRQMISSGASEADARAYKTDSMKKVYRILALCLGEPPVEFEWRYQTRDNKIMTLRSTPEDFFRSIIPENYDVDSYIMVMNDPTRPYYKVYEIENYRNTYEGINWRYLNLPVEELKAAALASIKNNEPLYASCDISRYYNPETGIADPQMYDYEALFGVDFEMDDKKARIMTRQSGSAHAMTLIAVDTDSNDVPVKWQFENSWGPSAGHDGYYTFTDSWFDDYMFRMVINRAYLSEKALKAAAAKPVMLPAWDYMF